MRTVEVFITHDPSGRERDYVTTSPPSIERQRLLSAKGFKFFRSTIYLPVDDLCQEAEATPAESHPS